MSEEITLIPASKCPSPVKLKAKDLPDQQSDNVENPFNDPDPLDFDAAGGLVGFGGPGSKPIDISSYTPSQLYDLNQQLLSDSVPPRPLIDEIVSMSNLREEYENGSVAFVNQIDWLTARGYDSVRRTRGDGDCFYRSLAFAYVERILQSPDPDFAVASSLSALAATRDSLDKAGIDKIVYEDIYDEFAGLIGTIVQPNSAGKKLNSAGLLLAFQSPEMSNAVVVYMRFLTSAEIRVHREKYEAFLIHPETHEPMGVEAFCANIVEPLGKEADHVEMQALCAALQLNVDVAYLNGGSEEGVVDFIPFRYASESESLPLVLLYRPGHYDLLIKGKSGEQTLRH